MKDGERIVCFRKEYFFLSNFFPAVMRYKGVTFLSSEAAFQAQKCSDSTERQFFSRMSPDEAKRYARRVDLRTDWNDVILRVMDEVLYEKFTQNCYLVKWLLNTGEKELVEGNTWGDVYWGVDLKTGMGENHLGKALMRLREYFRINGVPDGEYQTKIRFGPVKRMSAVFGDITQTDCMCVVNSANSSSHHGRDGVDCAIHTAAGPKLLEECKAFKEYKAGDVTLTKGYNLKAEYIIHAFGPRYPQKECELLLRQVYRKAMNLARAHNITSITFPAISAGASSYPKKEATMISVQEVYKWMNENADYPIDVEFSCVDNAVFDFFCDYLRQLIND